jgi:hypothetical protein
MGEYPPGNEQGGASCGFFYKLSSGCGSFFHWIGFVQYIYDKYMLKYINIIEQNRIRSKDSPMACFGDRQFQDIFYYDRQLKTGQKEY